MKNICNDPICLAIAIYGLLRHCLGIGKFHEYFGSGEYVGSLFVCEHLVDDSSHQYFCCRQRKARLLIVDCLLLVLREYRDSMHKSNEKGCTTCADSDDNDSACCPDMATLRPAPFYGDGYTEEEVERGDTSDLNRENECFKLNYEDE